MKAKVIIALITVLLYVTSIYSQEQNSVDNQSTETTEQNSGDDLLGGDLLNEGLSFKFIGQYKNLLSLQKRDDLLVGFDETGIPQTRESNTITDLHRLRLSPELKYGYKLLVHLDIDNELIVSNYADTREFDLYYKQRAYNNLLMMQWYPYQASSMLHRAKIHRAYAKISIGKTTLTLGRQQIRFGSAMMWNPLDMLNPVSPLAIEDAEEQPATDAARLNYYFDDKTELAIIFDPKRYNDEEGSIAVRNSNSVVRFKTTVNTKEETDLFSSTDVAFLAGYIARRKTVGVDVATIIYKGILRGSMVWYKPDDSRDFLQANAGYSYNFKNNISLILEYFYNQDSINNNRNLSKAYNDILITGYSQQGYFQTANRIITYNQHYAGMTLAYELTNLIKISVASIYEFQKKGLFLSSTINYSYHDNIDCFIGAMFARVYSGDKEKSDFYQYTEEPVLWAGLRMFF